MGLLLLATSWTGSWRLVTERGPAAMHLVIQDSEKVELYDPMWLPHEIKGVKLDEERIQVQAVVLESIHSFTLDATSGDGQRMSGTLTMKYPQWTSTVKFKGLKVAQKPFPSPVEWVARHRKGRQIDALGYCLKNAPRDDFESFQRFWNEAFEPSFYIFLQNSLYGAGNGRADRETTLKRVFESLDCYSKGSTQEEPPLDRVQDDVTEGEKETEESQPDCVVLMPGILYKEKGVEEVASIMNQFPPGHIPCCGDSLYSLETFEIQPVDCTQVAPESNEEPAATSEGSTATGDDQSP